MSIRTRLIIILLTFALIPSLFLGALVFQNSSWEVKKNALLSLKYITDVKEAALLEFMSSKRGRAVDFSTDGYIKESIRLINSLGPKAEKERAGRDLAEYLRVNKRSIDPDLIEIHILDPRGIVISSTDEEFIGKSEAGRPYFTEGLKGSYIQGRAVHLHGGKVHSFMPVSTPVVSGGKTIGVLMNGYSLDIIGQILSGRRSRLLGATSSVLTAEAGGIDIFIAGEDGFLITPTGRFKGMESKVFASLPVTECLEGRRELNGEWKDVSGNAVWGASMCMDIANGPVWALVVEQDKAYALAPIKALRIIMLIVGVSIAVVVGFTAFAMALSVSRPIARLRKGASVIATGNLDYKVGSAEKDEIGELSRSFDKMTADLKAVTASRDELTHEMSERKKAIEALRLSERKYKDLVDTSLAGIFRTNMKGNLLFANDALVRIFEFETPEEMLKEGVLSRYKNLAARKSLFRRLEAGEKVEAFEVEVLTKKGETRHMLLSATKQGDVIAGTMIDITERKRSEEIRREAQRSRALAEIHEVMANTMTDYRRLVEAISKYIGEHMAVPCVIRLLSRDGKVLEPVAVYHPDPFLLPLMRKFIASNPQYADRGVGGAVLGKEKQILFGAPDEIWKTITPESRADMESLGIKSALVTPIRSRGSTIGIIACFRPAQGESFSPDERLLVQDLADRAALAISAARLFQEIQRELALRKKAEEDIKMYASKLERSNTELQQFAYIASHDLREPLRMISGYLKLLEKKYSGRLDEKADSFIQYAMSGSDRMQKIIDDLLEFSRVSTQAMPFEAADLELALQNALENLQVAVQESGATITSGPMPVVAGDAVQLSQVFQNLIANAIKFRASGKKPVIRVSSKDGGAEWIFSVSDNGIGIPQEQRARIFEIFHRLHGPEYPGTGIGLAVCERIVKRHGGSIWVDSEPGRGSEFFFTIPKRALEELS